MNRDAIERSLLDIDGSCRDINFSKDISTVGAASLFEAIAARWKLVQASDAEGVVVQARDAVALFTKHKGALSTVWQGELSPRHLQAYFFWEEPDRVFCELTFFPADLDAGRFTVQGFLELLAVFASAARSFEYYVRYEDASWCHADRSAKSSVIFSHENIALLHVPSFK
ncbi:hypothetical protein [Massilia suwonensis]|uniref:Uncharacterized protein n=1 Tax=Massilia suwonensis TaxID=648895 RepID=A0ABW0MU88_9BURK